MRSKRTSVKGKSRQNGSEFDIDQQITRYVRRNYRDMRCFPPTGNSRGQPVIHQFA